MYAWLRELASLLFDVECVRSRARPSSRQHVRKPAVVGRPGRRSSPIGHCTRLILRMFPVWRLAGTSAGSVHRASVPLKSLAMASGYQYEGALGGYLVTMRTLSESETWQFTHID
jgi:hypothetical protein